LQADVSAFTGLIGKERTQGEAEFQRCHYAFHCRNHETTLMSQPWKEIALKCQSFILNKFLLVLFSLSESVQII
jgi:hypothetical protein